MISEFQQLSEKLARLAELAHTLRRENTDLRLSLSALANENALLATENSQLTARMQQASARVQALMDKLPTMPNDDEAEE